jgi:hypothetical protein
MLRAAPALCLLLALLIAPPVRAQDAVAATSFDVSELRRDQEAELSKVADAALKKGYATLARRCWARIAARSLAPDAAQARLTELQAQDDDAKLSAKTRASLDATFRKARQKIAAQAVTVAQQQPEGPARELAEMLAREAVQDDPDAKAARAILGHVRHKDRGWVNADDATRLAAGEVEIGDGWRPRKGLAKGPRPWGEEWVLRTDHFVVRSNLPWKRVRAAGDLLEALRERFLADWEGTLPLRADARPHEVLVFAAHDEYAAFIRANDPSHISGVPGQYSPNLRKAMFFDVETLRSEGGTTSSLVELMLHECTHQLMNELVAANMQALEGSSSPNHWLNEGLAEYYGMHTPSKKAGLVIDTKAIRGMLRTRQVKDNASRVPAASVMAAMTKETFQSPDGQQRVTHYAAAGFLCLHLSVGATRGGWQRLVRAVFTGGNPENAWAQSFGDAAGDVDASFAKLLKTL